METPLIAAIQEALDEARAAREQEAGSQQTDGGKIRNLSIVITTLEDALLRAMAADGRVRL